MQYRINKNLQKILYGKIYFQFYREGTLYFKTQYGDIVFPIPINLEHKTPIFAEEEAYQFKGYIEKFLDSISKIEYDKVPTYTNTTDEEPLT